ncbi:MAG: restriction endonuclease [Verrucomicrobiota bacterium]
MARRKDDGVLTLVYELARELFNLVPPWTCIPLAALTFAFFHFSLPSGSDFKPFTDLLGFAFALALIVAGFNAWQARAATLRLLRENIDLDWVMRLNWREFEARLADVYRLQGYHVEHLGGHGPDGGVDLRLRKDGETILVQCKHWRAWRVGVRVVRELYGILHAEHATRAILITSGRFTADAERFAAGKPIDLINDTKLLDLLRQFQRSQLDL